LEQGPCLPSLPLHAVVLPIVANIATAFATIEPELLEVMRSLGASRRDMTVKIGIPRSLRSSLHR